VTRTSGGVGGREPRGSPLSRLGFLRSVYACDPLVNGKKEKDVKPDTLLRQGLLLEYTTLGWNVVGVCITLFAALRARSVALAGFGLDSVIEIGASLVVIWQLTAAGTDRQPRALHLIGAAFFALAIYMLVQS
jgi:hypothetical protein